MKLSELEKIFLGLEENEQKSFVAKWAVKFGFADYSLSHKLSREDNALLLAMKTSDHTDIIAIDEVLDELRKK
jgi:hypothetical protein